MFFFFFIIFLRILQICNSISGAKTNKDIFLHNFLLFIFLSMINLELHNMTTTIESKSKKNDRWSLLSYLHLNIYKIVVFGLIIDSFPYLQSWTFNSI